MYRDIDCDIPIPDRGVPAGTRSWVAYTDEDFDANITVQSALARSLPYETGSFKHLCQLVNLLGSVVRNLYNQSEPANGRLTQNSDVVTELHVRLCTWFNQLPQYMRLGNGTPPPIVLVAHMFYHAALILLFRPFIRSQQPRSATSNADSPYDVSPHAICTSSAMAITKCLREYQHVYSLRRYSNWLVHAVLTSATVYVILSTGRVKTTANATTASSMCDPAEATRKLEETVAALVEMGAAWTNARRCAQQIQQWAERYNIRLRLINSITMEVPSKAAETAPGIIRDQTVQTSYTFPQPAASWYPPLPQENVFDMGLFSQQAQSGWHNQILDFH